MPVDGESALRAVRRSNGRLTVLTILICLLENMTSWKCWKIGGRSPAGRLKVFLCFHCSALWMHHLPCYHPLWEAPNNNQGPQDRPGGKPRGTTWKTCCSLRGPFRLYAPSRLSWTICVVSKVATKHQDVWAHVKSLNPHIAGVRAQKNLFRDVSSSFVKHPVLDPWIQFFFTIDIKHIQAWSSRQWRAPMSCCRIHCCRSLKSWLTMQLLLGLMLVGGFRMVIAFQPCNFGLILIDERIRGTGQPKLYHVGAMINPSPCGLRPSLPALPSSCSVPYGGGVACWFSG